MADDNQNQTPNKEVESTQSQQYSTDTGLESKEVSFKTADSQSESSDALLENDPNASTEPPEPPKKKNIFHKILDKFKQSNIYFLLFIFVLLLAGIAGFASYTANKKADNSSSIDSQSLSANDLQNLKNNNTTVGDSKQTLTIASNAIFNGKVLIRDNLDVAGTIKVGSALTLPGITVAGTSSFENVQISKNLSVAGNAALNGSLGVQGNFTLAGNANFTGSISANQLNINTLALNNDLQLNRHIDTGGATPRISPGGAVGGGGTVSISGTDTAGTINVNFGGGPPAGQIANVSFANNFNQTAHVVITPIGANCAALNYYVTSTTSGFTVGVTNSGNAGTSCGFNYIAMD